MEAQILSVRDFQQMQSYREQLISNSEPDALAAALLPSRKIPVNFNEAAARD
jgi:hypothetical protein